MPLFPAPAPPWYLTHEGNWLTEYNGANTLIANTTYLIAVYLPSAAVVTNMRVRHGAVSAGNIDMGIYDANGNLLDHTGVTACTGANTAQTIALSNGNLNLPQGRYYLALKPDNSTDTYYKFNSVTANTPFGTILISTATHSGALEATFTAMGGTSAGTLVFGIMAVLQ